MYEPLIRKAAKRFVNDEEATGDHIPPRIAEDVLVEAGTVFDNVLDAFEFYFDYRGKKRPLGRWGFIGFAENTKARELFDGVMGALGVGYRSRDPAEVAFAHHVRSRLSAWVAQMSSARLRHPESLNLDESVLDEEGDVTLGDMVSGT
jgi:hypothetical protein